MIDWILVVLCLGIGTAIGFLMATLMLKKATPEELWNKVLWALDRAEANPALRAKMENAAAAIQKKLEEWLAANWKN